MYVVGELLWIPYNYISFSIFLFRERYDDNFGMRVTKERQFKCNFLNVHLNVFALRNDNERVTIFDN